MAKAADPLPAEEWISRIERFAPKGVVYQKARADLFSDLEVLRGLAPPRGFKPLDLYLWTLGQIILAHLEQTVWARSTSVGDRNRQRQYDASRRKLERKLKELQGHPLLTGDLKYSIREAHEFVECRHDRSRNECEALYAQRESLELFKATGVIQKHHAELIEKRPNLLQRPRGDFCRPDVLPLLLTVDPRRGAPKKELQNRLLTVLAPAWKRAGVTTVPACRFVARILAVCFPGPIAEEFRRSYADDLVEKLADSLARQRRRLKRSGRRRNRHKQSGQKSVRKSRRL